MVYVSQLCGFIGVAISFTIMHQKNRRNLLVAKLISDIFWIIHYALIGAQSGATVFAIAAARSCVFLCKERKWARSRLWPALFIVFAAGSAAVTWKNIFSILPACASIMSIVNYWIGNPRVARRMQIPISLTFLVYNVVTGSYMGILNESLSQISVFAALFITEKRQKPNSDRI